MCLSQCGWTPLHYARSTLRKIGNSKPEAEADEGDEEVTPEQAAARQAAFEKKMDEWRAKQAAMGVLVGKLQDATKSTAEDEESTRTLTGEGV